jgi:hypothetical protein
MSDTVLYIVVFVAFAHFVIAAVFLLRKLIGPSGKGADGKAPELLDK